MCFGLLKKRIKYISALMVTGGIFFNNTVITETADMPERLVVCGEIAGIKIDMDGVMVLGEGGFKTRFGTAEPAYRLLREGDVIEKVNGKKAALKEDIEKAVINCKGKKINFEVNRGGKKFSCNILPAVAEDGRYRLGIWVRDSTQGLGTVTYYNNETGEFGALGHGITDVDTGRLMKAAGGKVCEAKVTATVKGKKGMAGELIGEIRFDRQLGVVEENNEAGVYGKAEKGSFKGKETEIGKKEDVKTGKAEILTDIDGQGVKSYSIQIEKINRFTADSSKSMTIKITDERLMEKTGGIIQGMSGSPIIQDGRIIGAVTHVFINKPNCGYGIFIENMLKKQGV